MDEFLKSFADRYERWRTGGDFTISSKVIPVQVSIPGRQWVLPGKQLQQILKEARSFALADCTCRTHYHRCHKPREVCFLLDDASDKGVERNKARRISLEEAAGILDKADEHGLVHMTLYQPGGKIYAICSCCPCCCHDLQLLRQYHRGDLVARSDYLAVTDREQCTDCGRCINRCVFGARELRDGIVYYDPGACLGCGLCVSVCPSGATGMRERHAGIR